MKKIVRALSILLVSIMVFLTGCVSNQQQPSSPQTDNSQKKEGTKTQIVIARPVDSNNLDYITCDQNVNIWMFNLALEGLVKSTDDGKNVEPCLAESWDISEDKLTYTFHLRKDVKFSDGTPVKGEDWVFSLKRARDTKESPWKFSMEAVKDIIAPDNNTVVITLNQPWAPILADLSMFNASVTSKAYFEKVGPEGFSQKPLGTGPYMFIEWKKGEYILFEKNPNYWQPGIPKTDQIKVTVVPDDSTRIMQLQAGDVDVVTFVPWNRMEELNKDPNLTTMTLPSTETRYIQINNTKKTLNNVKVRQALDMATDKEALMKTILYGFGEPAKSFMAKSGMYWNDQLQVNSYDPEKAKNLLKEAGYPNGFTVTLTVPSGNTVNQSIATMLKEQWSKIGVTLNLEMLEAATVEDKLTSLQSEIVLQAWTNDMIDPSEQVDYTCIYSLIQNFFTGWDNKEIEKLAVQAKAELDDTKRKEMYYKIQDLYFKDMPMITLFHVPYPVAMKKSIKGFVQTPLGGYRFENLEKVQ